ncbi:succinate dehydrogenase assembly factor 2 [Candidatus Pelagibacter sp.]|nr:succinate dehydrogenase assembly factor 2 [Candidatus Pelagibacter sp.]|tara:strand:- start:283 stop:546 length:264 start_codon:yes stop_codon:yes gene_type:complete
MNNDIENLKKKLVYRSQYRSTKEMDKLIGSFVRNNVNNFNLNQLIELEKFLTVDDSTLYKLYNNHIESLEGVNEKLIKLYKSHVYKS